MSVLFHRLRLVPIVLFAAAGLFILKVSGIVMDGGYTLGAGHQAKNEREQRDQRTVIVRSAEVAPPQEPARPKSWAQEMFGYPDVTGSVGASKPAPAKETAAPEKPVDPKFAKAPPKAQSGTVVQLDAPHISPSERALLERLSERRAELEKRQSELDMRDTLLKAAEKKLGERLNELKQAEERIVAATQQKEEVELQRLKNLVTMYESMKAKEAAKIFEKLDVKLATDVARLIQPRRMSEILAQMTPEAAQRLTVELASRPQGDTRAQAKPQELPKIEGRPNGS
jgi:flagellar motility protein MotE (MotC chaperone)